MASAEPLATRQQKKIIRTLTRLKHSLAADREIEALLEEHERVGAEGASPRLEATLQDILEVE